MRKRRCEHTFPLSVTVNHCEHLYRSRCVLKPDHHGMCQVQAWFLPDGYKNVVWYPALDWHAPQMQEMV